MTAPIDPVAVEYELHDAVRQMLAAFDRLKLEKDAITDALAAILGVKRRDRAIREASSALWRQS